MAEFNRTALDMMDELYAPYKESRGARRLQTRKPSGCKTQRWRSNYKQTVNLTSH